MSWFKTSRFLFSINECMYVAKYPKAILCKFVISFSIYIWLWRNHTWEMAQTCKPSLHTYIMKNCGLLFQSSIKQQFSLQKLKKSQNWLGNDINRLISNCFRIFNLFPDPHSFILSTIHGKKFRLSNPQNLVVKFLKLFSCLEGTGRVLFFYSHCLLYISSKKVIWVWIAKPTK